MWNFRRPGVSSLLAFMMVFVSSMMQIAATPAGRGKMALTQVSQTTTPIQHVVIIIGENHTFDNLFGAYQPRKGQTIDNLLSKGIITATGKPGKNAKLALQQQASDTKTYSINPEKTGLYKTLPQPNTNHAQGQPTNVPDSRFPAHLPNRPYQITDYVPYPNSFIGDPIHRFYQMWQQTDKGKNDLYTWTANTAGDDNGAIMPQPIYQGALSMGFYNMGTGDAPAFHFIADNYAISDNYHQPVMGGTGMSHFMLGTGDMPIYTDGRGNPLVPPKDQIENPNPRPATNNSFIQDGYAGGSYSKCADRHQPGVASILNYLHAQSHQPFRDGNCAPGTYYLLNNYEPGYTPTGQLTTSTPFAVPPQTLPTLADALSARSISWKYYGQGFNNGNVSKGYCGICDPFQYSTSIMTTKLRQNIQGLQQFQSDVEHNTLPAVSFIKPDSLHDGHPASSSLSLFENFASNITNEVIGKPDLFKKTAVFITFDEGGGYYDSGFIQPIDFFGDGPRIPLLLISPYARQGYVDHTYNDHVSLLKFIERNWKLGPLSARSRDNLPDPQTASDNGYIPTNGPAIGDMMQLFDFNHPHLDTQRLPSNG